MNLEQEPPMLASIKFIVGPHTTDDIFYITKAITTVGRDTDNDIIVSDPRVSRFHARLVYDNDVWKIENLSQSSTISIDKKIVEQAILSHHHIIGLGEDTSFLFFPAPVGKELVSEATQFFTSPVAMKAVEEASHEDTHAGSEEITEATQFYSDSATADAVKKASLADTLGGIDRPKELASEETTQFYSDIEVSNAAIATSHEDTHVGNEPSRELLLGEATQFYSGTEVADAVEEASSKEVLAKPQAPVQSMNGKQTPIPAEQNKKATGTELASFASMGISSLEVTDNTTGVRKRYPLIQERINIGRDETNTIVIDTENISDFHLRIAREKNQWVLLHPHPDQKQTLNGLIYQGQSIQGDEPFRKSLAHGDVFRIGDEHGALITLTYSDSSDGPRVAPPKVQPIRLGPSELTLGRLPDNSVVLDHPQVSAHHAQLLQEQGTYRLTDLGSTNHTYVNGLQVSSQLLQSQDEIRIGPFRFIYDENELSQFDESAGIRIDVLNLKKVGNNQTVLLNDISLSIPSRSFVAFVGGSGAGKTTLLDAISGLRPAQEGSVLYNGQDYYHNLAAFSTQLGYVPQDDIIHRELTVERALYYAAKLRLPQDFSESQIEQRIEEVLDDVEMKHRRKLLISQLSGGQRKRVSIALELLAKPSIFFLDEPTSGLDPGLDRKMMILLRKLADKGHTVILVTHATNNINACDYVCFLAQGGNLAYFGPPEEAKTYFRQPDFAEIYSVLEPRDENRSIPLEAKAAFEQSPGYERYIRSQLRQGPRTSTQVLREEQRQTKISRKGSSRRQFVLLTRRYLELLKNDTGNLAVLLLQAPLIGIMLMLFIKSVGPDGFSTVNVLACPSTAAIISSQGYIDTPTPINTVVSMNCQRVEDFLNNTSIGQSYAHARGGTIKALGDFMISGKGYAGNILFLMAFSAIMFGCVNAIREIVKEAPIYRRERTVNLGILPYIFSKIVVLGILCLVQSLILIACVAVFDPFHHSIFLPPFLEIYITIALTSLAGLMLGLLVSSVAPNNDRAVSFVPLILIPQVIFSGAIFPLTSQFLQYPSVLFPVRWAMVALGSSAGLHSDKFNGDQLFGDNYSYHGTLFSSYSQAEATQYLSLMWLALVVMILVFGVAMVFFLKRKDLRA